VSVNDLCFDLVVESVEEVGVNENHHENNDGLAAAGNVTQNDDDEMDSQNLHVCHGVVEVVNVIYHLNNVEVNHFRDELVVEVSLNRSHLCNDDGLAVVENVNQSHPCNAVSGEVVVEILNQNHLYNDDGLVVSENLSEIEEGGNGILVFPDEE